ncbi:MAG: hypothetical protein AAGF12_11310 [Myxococcota bacterium]
MSNPEHTPDASHTRWQRLAHRWFVEYNPLYLVSATLVLGGITVLAKEVVDLGSIYGGLLIGAIAETYCLLLIGGAAILYRATLRRPAALLGLLAVLFQCDLTMQVEMYSYLDGLRWVAGALWFVLFFGKVAALRWAFRLSLPRRSYVLLGVAALGLAVLPQLFRRWSTESRTEGVLLWLFVLVAGWLWSTRFFTANGLDSKRTRTIAAAWAIFAVLLGVRIGWWGFEYRIDLLVLMPLALLLAARFIGSEVRVWATMTVALAAVALLFPAYFALYSFVAALLCVARSWRRPQRLEDDADPVLVSPCPDAASPYRRPPPPPRFPSIVFVPVALPARRRMLLGALATLYLAIWTRGWDGGAFPLHELWLDGAVVLMTLTLAYRWRSILPLLIPFGVVSHPLVQSGHIRAPESALGWAVVSVGAGFVLLIGNVAVALYLRRRGIGFPDPDL